MSSWLETGRVAGECAGCRHFNDRPLDLEAALPGLSSLSSAYAAVRSQDGICALHDRYVAATSRCPLYAERTEAGRTEAGCNEAGCTEPDVIAPPPAPGNRRKSAPCPSR